MQLVAMLGTAALVLATATACVKNGTAVEEQPVASLAPYMNASMAVEAPADMKNSEQYRSGFDSAL